MKRVTYALTLVIVMALLGGFSGQLVAGQTDSGTPNATVTVTAVPKTIYTPVIIDVSHSVDVNGVFTEEVTGQSADKMLELDIPEGTTGLTEEGQPLSEIDITAVEDPPPPPEDYNVIGLAYDLGPDGVTFYPPITVTFTYDKSLIPEGVAEENLVIAMWNAASSSWIPLQGCSIDPETKTISGPVIHFTDFTVLAPTPPPSPDLGGGGEPPPAPSLTTIINALGKTTVVRLKSDGTLLQSCVIADPADNVILEFDSGTKIICSDNEVPERLEVSLPGEPPPMPEGFAAVSPVYDLTAYISGGVPRPVTFDPPARLQINYSPQELPENVLSVFIAYHDEEEGWTQLEPPTGFVAGAGETAARVSHFTPFVVMADLAAPPLPARFEVRNLDINPIQVTAGKDITISAQLVNVGGLRGEYTLMVNIEGLLETSQVIRLAPGQSQIITFTVTPGSSGSYQVEIGDLRGNFVAVPISPPEVTEPEPGVPGAVSYGWLIAVISAVAALAVLAFIIATKRLQHALGMERGWFEKPAKPLTTAGRRLRRAPLVAKPAEPVPSALRVGNLKITPNQVKPGETITVFAEATNTSLVTSSYSLVLKIKGIAEAVKEITLSPGQSQKVAFTIIKTKPGVYDVDLEDLKGSFTVEEVAAPPDSSSQ